MKRNGDGMNSMRKETRKMKMKMKSRISKSAQEERTLPGNGLVVHLLR